MVYSTVKVYHYDEFLYDYENNRLYFSWCDFKSLPNGYLFVNLEKDGHFDFFHRFVFLQSGVQTEAERQKLGAKGLMTVDYWKRLFENIEFPIP